MQKIFINHTNHPSDKWSAEQISAAKVYGDIKDIPFPAIEPRASSAQIKQLVKENLKEILELKPAVVLCQGEFNYTFEMVTLLKNSGIKVIAATSERRVSVEILADGRSQQVSTFCFVRFREY